MTYIQQVGGSAKSITDFIYQSSSGNLLSLADVSGTDNLRSFGVYNGPSNQANVWYTTKAHVLQSVDIVDGQVKAKIVQGGTYGYLCYIGLQIEGGSLLSEAKGVLTKTYTFDDVEVGQTLYFKAASSFSSGFQVTGQYIQGTVETYPFGV
jgi:hypothetical protein